jgi:hypothetical protein
VFIVHWPWRHNNLGKHDEKKRWLWTAVGSTSARSITEAPKNEKVAERDCKEKPRTNDRI